MSNWTGFVVKTADESKTGTTLADDALLVLTLNASKKYRFRLQFMVWTNATADFKYTIKAAAVTAGGLVLFGGPTTLSTVLSSNYETAAPCGQYWHALTDITGGTTRTLAGNNTTTARAIVTAQGMIQTPASSPGTLAFQWAQNVNNATPTTVFAGSFLGYTEI